MADLHNFDASGFKNKSENYLTNSNIVGAVSFFSYVIVYTELSMSNK